MNKFKFDILVESILNSLILEAKPHLMRSSIPKRSNPLPSGPINRGPSPCDDLDPKPTYDSDNKFIKYNEISREDLWGIINGLVNYGILTVDPPREPRAASHKLKPDRRYLACAIQNRRIDPKDSFYYGHLSHEVRSLIHAYNYLIKVYGKELCHNLL